LHGATFIDISASHVFLWSQNFKEDCLKNEKIAIVGMGPIGSILAVYLVRGGFDVTAVDILRDHLEKMRTDGLLIEGKESLSARITKTFWSIQDLCKQNKKFDFVFLCVKTPVIKQVIGDLPSVLEDTAAVISFQNGLDMETDIAEVVGSSKTLRGVVNYAGNMNGPGMVSMTFFNPPNYLGAAVQGDTTAQAKARRLAAILTETGLSAEFTEDIHRHVWAKVIRNSMLMPISALTGMNMAQIMESPIGEHMVRQLLKECVQVAAKQGYVFDQQFCDDSIAYVRKGGSHVPSMLSDVRAGRVTEIEFLNHRIAEYANSHGIEVPYNRIIADLLRCIDQLHKANRQDQKTLK
jgi:2-dehydropantoate 2-reductase